MKRFFAVMLMLVMVVSCFAACSDEVQEGIFQGFEAQDLEGNTVTDEIFKDKKVTMVNIWGTFCSPCIKEMPDLQKLHEAYADKGFQVVGVVCDAQYASGEIIESKLDEAKSIMADTGVEYVSILPYEALNNSVLAGSYSIPLTYFVDSDGNILGESYVGSKSYEGWEQIILGLLG